MSAIAAAVGSVAGAYISSRASTNAANTQAAAARDAAAAQTAAADRSAQLQHDATIRGQDLQQQMFQQAAGYLAPYRQAGERALSTLDSELTDTGPNGLARRFTLDDFYQYSPAYEFQRQQAMGQAENMANRSGGLLSGNALQGLNTFAQNYAQTAYQQAFSNFQTEQANRYSRLMGVAQLGGNAAAGAGQGAISTGQNVAQTGMAGAQGMASAYTTGANAASGYLTSGAAAQAAGQVGSANALTGGINSYLGWNYLYGRNQPSSPAPAGLSQNYWQGQFNPTS
ncbi:MAG TPA: hypothetical protein PKA20_17375 [Burkholderiaceae bacterium]|nr:hypothetical protein [Burkholderiaceae bacterium]